jgi:hypothetical protein
MPRSCCRAPRSTGIAAIDAGCSHTTALLNTPASSRRYDISSPPSASTPRPQGPPNGAGVIGGVSARPITTEGRQSGSPDRGRPLGRLLFVLAADGPLRAAHVTMPLQNHALTFDGVLDVDAARCAAITTCRRDVESNRSLRHTPQLSASIPPAMSLREDIDGYMPEKTANGTMNEPIRAPKHCSCRSSIVNPFQASVRGDCVVMASPPTVSS